MTQIQTLVIAIIGCPGIRTTFIHALLRASPFGSMDGEGGCAPINWQNGKVVGEYKSLSVNLVCDKHLLSEEWCLLGCYAVWLL
jgi:hypothetical protein